MSTDLTERGKRQPRFLWAEMAWKVCLWLGVAMVVGYFVLPTRDLQDYLYQLPGMLAAVAVVAGVVIHRPPDRRSWLILAAGLALSSGVTGSG